MAAATSTSATPFNLAGASVARPKPNPAPSSVESEDEDDRPQVGAKGITRDMPKARVLVGKKPRGHDPRRYAYDVVAGRGANLSFSVTRDDRMSAEEAGRMMRRIHKLLGVDTADPSILYAFDRGLFFCHTVNGGSVLNPGRSQWSVPGYTEPFDYGKVRDILGVDLRRFFRAYADDITRANKWIIDNYDPDDITAVEHYGWLMEVAADRGLTRYPQLAHDSASACVELNVTERNAVMRSSKLVIGTGVNSADRLFNTSQVQSADGFDSTTGESVK